MKNNEYDLAVEMDKFLNPEKIKKRASDNAVEEALSNLDKAAEILDAMGKFGSAEVITQIMEQIPARIKTAQPEHGDPAGEDFLRTIILKTEYALDMMAKLGKS